MLAKESWHAVSQNRDASGNYSVQALKQECWCEWIYMARDAQVIERALARVELRAVRIGGEEASDELQSTPLADQETTGLVVTR